MSMGKRLILFVVLLNIVSPRLYCQDDGQIIGSAATAEDCPRFLFLRGIFDFKCIRYAEEFFNCIVWLFQFIVDIVYYILNTVVVTCFEITSNVFSGVKQIVKVVEFVGYCVRVVMDVNYKFVYSVLASGHRLLELLVEGLQYLAETLVSVIVSFFRSIIKLLHNIVMIVPQAFQFGFSGTWAAKETVGSVLYNSYLGWKYIITVPGSALMAVITTTRAVLECMFVTLLNTISMISELSVGSVLQSFQFLIEIGAAVSSYIASAWDGVVYSAKLIDSGIRHFVSTTFYLFLCGLESLVRFCVSFTQAIFQQIYNIFHAVGGSVVNTALYGWNTTCTFFGSLLGLFQRSLQGLQILLRLSSHYSLGGRWTITSILSASILMLCSWLAFGLNLVVPMFENVEKLVQSVMRLLSSRPLTEGAQVREQRWMDTGRDKEGNPGDLRDELDQERERHLCVVCQDQRKNMIVMPCRHLCLCRQCSGELLRLRRWQNKACPLCRGRITSILEVYT